jgi:hypothetical protein
LPLPSPGPDELQALAAKYRALAALRAGRDAGDTPTREVIRDLAARQPGSLRELDTLGQAELDRRARVTAAAAAGSGPQEPWMVWIAAYHRLMRATLLVKRAIGGGQPAPAGLAEEASRLAGMSLDPGFLTEVARPPQGRLGVLVLRRLAALAGVPAAEISRILFPPRRDPPYTLG